MTALLFKLLIAHAVCDYPLQGDFLARGKNHRNPLPGIPWYQCLFAHALIQAGGVYVATGSATIAGYEFAAHAVTDWLKSEGAISFNMDQAIHITFKFLWVVMI